MTRLDDQLAYERRVQLARETQYYEQWRERFTQWITVSGMTNTEIMRLTNLSISSVKMIITVLGLTGAERPVTPARWLPQELAWVRIIRKYTAAWDRGW